MNHPLPPTDIGGPPNQCQIMESDDRVFHEAEYRDARSRISLDTMPYHPTILAKLSVLHALNECIPFAASKSQRMNAILAMTNVHVSIGVKLDLDTVIATRTK
jgi:hypothetical protein